jgi:leucyl aminopeptidase (aminopeptidase T)
MGRPHPTSLPRAHAPNASDSVHDDRVPAWRPDWNALAEQIVDRTLRVRPGERVVYLADPDAHPECLESVRDAVLRAGGIEQATMLAWTERLARLRPARGSSRSLEVYDSEREAHRELFAGADVFIWLPTGLHRLGAVTPGESEWILGRWRGRGLHFHWFPDAGTPPGHPVHLELERIYERAVLKLDYAAHARRQQRVVDAIRGKSLRVTTPAGTDLRFDCTTDGWYHRNDGDGSRERVLSAICARDREQELPCGAVRTVPAPNSANGVIKLRAVPAWNGFGLDIAAFGADLDIVFRHGRITELRSASKQNELDLQRGSLRGDWDRLGEIVIGTNPLLETPPGARMPTYWGFGEGWLRLHLGDNLESGGSFSANLWINLFIGDTTVEANGEVVLRQGKLLIE